MESIFCLEIVFNILDYLSNYDLYIYGSTSKRSLEHCEVIWKQRYLLLDGTSKRKPMIIHLNKKIAERLEWSLKYRVAVQDIFLQKVKYYLNKQLLSYKFDNKQLLSYKFDSQKEMMKYIRNNNNILEMKNDEMDKMRRLIKSRENKAITYIHNLLADELDEYLKINNLKEQKRIKIEEGFFLKCSTYNNDYIIIGIVPKESDSIYKVGIDIEAFEIKDFTSDSTVINVFRCW